MGVVYEAMHQKLRQRVAIKMLLPTMLDPIIVERFEREARAAAKLTSRHVARVIDVDATPAGLPYMVMEFLHGQDLDQELVKRGRLSVEEAVDYLLQACAAMNEAHGLGIVHRDLKPSNLFLAADGPDACVVKVLDFGISKVAGDGDAKLTGAETMMGTAMYMSPEQVRSSGAVDARTDIWSLGVILYELLSGRPPFQGSATQVAAQIVTEPAPNIRSLCLIPAELAAVVERALEMRPDKRFQSVRDLVVALAPHAPPGCVGRALADNIMFGSSSPRVSAPVALGVGGASDAGPTMLQAGAVSQAARGADGGTAPGWTQPGATSSRSTKALLGMLLAFVGGTVVLGGGAYLVLRARGTTPAPGAAAAATETPTASSPAHDPVPPATEAAPPATGASGEPPARAAAAAPSPAAAPAAAAPRGRHPTAPATPTPPSTTTGAAPVATPSPPPGVARPPKPAPANPLIL
jgi:serine/threonine-protein kinase